MIIDYNNIQSSEDIYEHDFKFSGLEYNYEKRTVRFKLIHTVSNAVQLFLLNNVVLFDMQSCSFWHGGNSVYYIQCHREHPFFQHLDKIQEENLNNISGSYLDTQKKYIVFELQINSGDQFLAICESVDYVVQR